MRVSLIYNSDNMPEWLWIALLVFVFLVIVGSYLWLRTVDEVGRSGAWMLLL